MRSVSIVLLAMLFTTAGLAHLLAPGLYRPVMPRWLPSHDTLIVLSGVAEILGGIGLLMPRTRRAAGVGLILLLAAVLPANVEMLRAYRAQGVSRLAETLLWLRLPLQGLLMWWVWYTAVRRHRRPRPHRSS